MKEDSDFKGGKTEFVKTKLMTRLTYTLEQVLLYSICKNARCQGET